MVLVTCLPQTSHQDSGKTRRYEVMTETFIDMMRVYNEDHC